MALKNYTLGRGALHFSRFKTVGTDTQVPEGYRYVGNTPDLSFTVAADSLDHFSSDHGIKEKDDSVNLSVTRTGAFTTDDIDPANLALFFFGVASLLVQASAANVTETLTGVKAGFGYFMGVTPTTPVGVKGFATFAAAKAGAALVLGTDYTVDMDSGIVAFIPGGAVVDGDSISVTYGLASRQITRVVSGDVPVEGSLRYIAANPKGLNFDYLFPWVKVTPNGDMNMKGDTWQSIPFNLEILKKSTLNAVYMDGRPIAVA